MPEYWPEPLVVGLSRLTHRQPFANLVVTNVPGPPRPLYLMGSQMLEVFPLVPLARNLTANVGILSYGQQLTIGLGEGHVLGSVRGRSGLVALQGGDAASYPQLYRNRYCSARMRATKSGKDVP
jgi:hypothetical protein